MQGPVGVGQVTQGMVQDLVVIQGPVGWIGAGVKGRHDYQVVHVPLP
jgi:hypothetical protein